MANETSELPTDPESGPSVEFQFQPQSRPTRLLTTRPRIVIALALTSYVFWLALHGPLHLGHTPSGRLLPLDSVLHGWVLVAVNAALYLYLSWIALLFIRNCEGRERLFMIGWVAHLALYPMERLWPWTHRMIQYAGAVGLAVAMIAALSLLLHPAASADTSGQAA